MLTPSGDLFEKGFFKERILIKRKAREADIRQRTDFDKFYTANYEWKRLLLLENVIRSIKAIAARSKSDFDSDKLIKDILQAYEVKPEASDHL